MRPLKGEVDMLGNAPEPYANFISLIDDEAILKTYFADVQGICEHIKDRILPSSSSSIEL